MAANLYFSLKHEPPNGGIPPNARFAQAVTPLSTPSAQATAPSNANPTAKAHSDSGPPHGGAPPNGGSVGPPPPAYCPPPSAPVAACSATMGPPPPPYYSSATGYQIPGYGALPAPLAMTCLPLPPPAVATFHGFSGPAYEPPGQYVDGNMLRGQGWSYIAPNEHTTIHFVWNGLRPCDFPNGYYPYQFPYLKHKVSCTLSVRELIESLGCPSGAQKGITELICLGNDHFAAGDTFTQGGEASKRTLGQVGWTEARSEGTEVWLVVKR